jgi:hypothetical protein
VLGESGVEPLEFGLAALKLGKFLPGVPAKLDHGGK